jgi:hypothetical protein
MLGASANAADVSVGTPRYNGRSIKETHQPKPLRLPEVPQVKAAPLVMSIPLTYVPYSDPWTDEYQPETYSEAPQKWWDEWAIIAQAVFAFFLVMVGVFQARLTQRQAKIASEQASIATMQADIANRQMLIAHRPKIIVRRIEMLTCNAETPLAIRYLFVNIGQTDAINVEFLVDYVVVKLGTHITGRATYRRTKQKPVPPFHLGSGVPIENDFVDNGPLGASSADIKSGSQDLMFYGQIAYNDGLGNSRRTGFVRRYSPETGRFVRTKDEDNEYVD